MQKKVILMLLLINITTFFIKAQAPRMPYEYDSRVCLFEIDNIGEIEFIIHENMILYKIDSEKESNTKTPEGLAQSRVFASNKEWANRNYYDTTSKTIRDDAHFSAIKKLDKKRNYIRFIDKYCYNSEGKQMCLINFKIHLESVNYEIPLIISCIKVNNKWYELNLPNQFWLEEVLLNYKPDVLQKIFLGKETEDKLFNELLKQVKINDYADIEHLYRQMVQWKKNNNYELLERFTFYKKNKE